MSLISNKVDIQLTIELFKKILIEYFHSQVNENILATLSNMLALYYSSELNLKKKYSDQAYIEKCSKRLRIYIADKSIERDSFAISLTLFAVAITDNGNYTEDINNNINKVNEVIVDYLSQILVKDIKCDISLVKGQVSGILAQKEASEDKVQFILDNKSKLLSTKLVSGFNDKKQIELKEEVSNQKTTNRLIGASLALGATSFVVTTLLGPVAIAASLPLAYLGLNLGGKAIDQAEKILKPTRKGNIYSRGDDELVIFKNILLSQIQKVALKESDTLKKQEKLSLQPTINKIQANNLENIVEALSQAKTNPKNNKQAIENKLLNTNKKHRGI